MLQGKYPLVIALVLGIAAGLVAYSAVKAREAAVRKGWETKQVLCAQADVSEGTEVEEEMIGVCEIPERFVTDSFIVVPEGDKDASAVMPYGQKLLVPLKTGDPVLYSHFESRRSVTLSESIPPKARAVAIEVAEKGSVNQWVRPNDHVDVIGTFRDPNTHELVSITLLENIIVLATGHYSGMSAIQADEDKRYQQVVLMTLPEEAEILTLAAESGTLTLALRNPKDLDLRQAEGARQKTDTNTLLSGERTEALRKTRTMTFQGVDIIRGTERLKETKDVLTNDPPEQAFP